MAWTIDTNFGSNLVAFPAKAPFGTSGGNRMLSGNGAGLTYRDDLNLADVELSCDLFYDGPIPQDRNTGICLVARRQGDGSCYFATIYYGTSAARNVVIYKYNGTSDTFTQIGSANIPSSHPSSWNQSSTELLQFVFRAQGNSFTAYVFNQDTQQLALQIGTIDSEFSSAGNPGIGARLTVAPVIINTTHPNFIDNLEIDSI